MLTFSFSSKFTTAISSGINPFLTKAIQFESMNESNIIHLVVRYTIINCAS